MENNFQQTISNDELNAMPTIHFEGKIVIVDSDKGLVEACNDLLSSPVVGFDTETRPKFSKGAPNKVALLQLSTAKVCYLFRLNMMRLDKSIIKVLESKSVAKIGLDLKNDMSQLRELRHFSANNMIDLQSIAQQWGVMDKSLRKMSAIVLGGKISKAQRLSNWEAQKLTEAQKIYAATDAWVSREIYMKLLKTDKL